MPVYIPSDIRLGVIYEWLRGILEIKLPIYNISTGAATNIVNEWRNNIGAYIAENLRELSVSLKKANITPVQCSTGFRVAKIMERLGITVVCSIIFIISSQLLSMHASKQIMA